jgi:hypothetical protein
MDREREYNRELQGTALGAKLRANDNTTRGQPPYNCLIDNYGTYSFSLERIFKAHHSKKTSVRADKCPHGGETEE